MFHNPCMKHGFLLFILKQISLCNVDVLYYCINMEKYLCELQHLGIIKYLSENDILITIIIYTLIVIKIISCIKISI